MTQILIFVAGSIIVLILTGLYKMVHDFVKDHKETHQKLEGGSLVILQDRLEYLTSKYILDGCITLNQLASITNMYEAYHNLGGNEWITLKVQKVKKLKIIKED